MKKNYGLKIDKKKDKNAFVLGGFSSLPKVVLQADGQWDSYLPERELQYSNLFDSYNCTGYSTNAIFETLLNKLGDKMGDRSDRWLGIKSGTKPPGNDPHKVAQTARDYGLIAESSLPFKDISSISEYFSFKGSDALKCDLEAQDFLKKYEIGHEYVWSKKISKDERMYRIKESLTYSPIGLSVSAWYEKEGVFVDNGKTNNHWVMGYGWNDQGIKVFDTYDQTHKIVSWEHNIQVCKRYMLTKQVTQEELNILFKMLQAINNWLNAWKAEKEANIAPSPVLPQPEAVEANEPKGSLLIEWAKAIELYEGANKSWNNPGAIRSPQGPFMKFKTYQEGFDYLCHYLTRCATGKHKSYPKGGETTLLEFQRIYSPTLDNNNPEVYASFVAKRIGVTIHTKIKDLV